MFSLLPRDIDSRSRTTEKANEKFPPCVCVYVEIIGLWHKCCTETHRERRVGFCREVRIDNARCNFDEIWVKVQREYVRLFVNTNARHQRRQS